MWAIFYNNCFQYFTFSILFILIFKVIESKFSTFTKTIDIISKKINLFAFCGICIIVFGVLSAFVISYFNLNQTLSTILYCFWITLIISLISFNSSKLK